MDPYNPYDTPIVPSASSANANANRLVDEAQEWDEAHIDRMMENEMTDERDYYAILNVDRKVRTSNDKLTKKATDDDIRNSYKRLAILFHPDRHASPEDKSAAEQRFQLINRAYDVLSTPGKKATYDLYGEKGLMQIGQRHKSAEEIRAEYDKFVRERAELEAEAMVKSRGEVLLSWDATSLLLPQTVTPKANKFAEIIGIHAKRNVLAEPLPLWKRIQMPKLSNLFVRHAWTTQFSPYSTLFLSGFATARNGMGAGGALAHLRHIFAPDLWAEASLNVGQMGQASLKVSRNFASNVWTNVTLTSTSLQQPPALQFVAGRQLTPSINAYTTLGSGDYKIGSWGEGFDSSHPNMSVGLIKQVRNHAWNVDVGSGLDETHVQSSYTYIVPKRGLLNSGVGSGTRLRASATVSTNAGLVGNVTAERKVAKHSRLGITVEAGYMSGILLKLRWNRLGQKLTLPFTLSTVADPRTIVLACLLPVLAGLALDRLFISPRVQARVQEKLAKIREMNAETFETRKQEAEDAQRLMRDQVMRKCELERTKGGLVIVSASYGKADLQLDVTLPIQALVNSGQLYIPGGQSKSGLVGFYDPCYGEAKQLTVTYRFQGQLHRASVGDLEPLACPLRGHQIADDLVEGIPVGAGVAHVDDVAAPNLPRT